jgi:hypothetical protein
MAFLTSYLTRWINMGGLSYSDAGKLDLGSGGNLANSQLSEFFLKAEREIRSTRG